MAYTPELSFKSLCTLRRIAWAMNVSTNEALEIIIEYIPEIVEREKVCLMCRDKRKCRECSFLNKPTNGD